MRVIAGELRGRRFAAPKGMATRPTSDRVREAVFSILRARFAAQAPVPREGSAGARVLDLFAGSGAMAIEALSRGAASAVLVESSGPVCALIEANLAALGLSERASVICAPVERYLGAGPPTASNKPSTGPFDLIFADPPYRIGTVSATRMLADAARQGWMSPGALVVLEHSARDLPEGEAGLELVSTRRYGDTQISIFEEETPSARP
jgi:16S rRNA (guanine966-N2)-methyltransferase